MKEKVSIKAELCKGEDSLCNNSPPPLSALNSDPAQFSAVWRQVGIPALCALISNT